MNRQLSASFYLCLFSIIGAVVERCSVGVESHSLSKQPDSWHTLYKEPRLFAVEPVAMGLWRGMMGRTMLGVARWLWGGLLACSLATGVQAATPRKSGWYSRPCRTSFLSKWPMGLRRMLQQINRKLIQHPSHTVSPCHGVKVSQHRQQHGRHRHR